MTIFDAQQLAHNLMIKHGLMSEKTTSGGWSFRFNHAKRMLGVCRFHEKRIELSRHFVEANSREAVEDTILHEIAHALAGPKAGHGPKWKAVCQQIGAKPERLDHTSTMPAGRWVATCSNCGLKHRRHRRPLRERTYICSKCGPKLGKLKWQRRDGVE